MRYPLARNDIMYVSNSQMRGGNAMDNMTVKEIKRKLYFFIGFLIFASACLLIVTGCILFGEDADISGFFIHVLIGYVVMIYMVTKSIKGIIEYRRLLKQCS